MSILNLPETQPASADSDPEHPEHPEHPEPAASKDGGGDASPGTVLGDTAAAALPSGNGVLPASPVTTTHQHMLNRSLFLPPEVLED